MSYSHIQDREPATMAKEKKEREMFTVFNYFCIDEARSIHLGSHHGNIQRLGLEVFQNHTGKVMHPVTGMFVCFARIALLTIW